MTDSPDETEAQRQRIVRGRNRMLAWILIGFVVLTFAISMAKMG